MKKRRWKNFFPNTKREFQIYYDPYDNKENGYYWGYRYDEEAAEDGMMPHQLSFGHFHIYW